MGSLSKPLLDLLQVTVRSIIRVVRKNVIYIPSPLFIDWHDGLPVSKFEQTTLRILVSFTLLFAIAAYAPLSHAGLSLDEVENLALENEPSILAQQAKGAALQAQSIADGQLPDPKLGLGIYNVPLDDFDLKKQPTTQFRTKISQAFPRGGTLQYQQKYSSWKGKAEIERADLSKQQVIRDVRQSYLELHYQLQAEQIVTASRDLFKQLVDVTRVMFSSGRVSQQDVLRAQLELSRLDERSTRIAEMQDVQRAKLSRWLGDAAWGEMENAFPRLATIPAKSSMLTTLSNHPLMRVSDANVTANQQLVHRAREQYKPGWNVGLEYRKRFGNNPDGSDREDMMAAMVTLDLPIFTNKRQDQHLASSQKKTEMAKQQRELRLRELQRQLLADYARWKRLGEQQTLYEKNLMQEASENTRAAIHAYQSGTTEFNALMRASITELDVRLQELRVRIDRAKTQARLLYLLPETGDMSAQGDES